MDRPFRIVISAFALAAAPLTAEEPHHHAPPGVPAPALGPVVHVGNAPEHGVPIYENLAMTGFSYTLGSTIIADDLHMASGGGMVSFSFAYYGSQAFCGGFWGGSATIRFYQNNATNTLLPGAATLIASFDVPISSTAPAGQTFIRHVDLPNPVALPQDVWMAISFSPIPGGSGAVTAAAVPAVGSSLNAHYTGSAGYVTAPFGFAYANYMFAVYVPAPSTAALALAGLGAALRRRR
jgi:uncharacterized protein (TIGR03382 family)